jgi:uncharacterized protein (DUF697 family)
VTEHVPIDHMQPLPKSLWEQLRAEPERAPELLALAAADRFAPQAEHWVRVAGPGHDPAELARIAHRKHVRLARLEGATLGIGGALTSAADLAALAWIQSRMVFYIAAAYGYEPRHPMRPAELLALQGLYETPAEARAALDGIGRPIAHAMVGSALSSNRDQAIASRLMKYAGKRAARKVAGRALPLVSSPIAAVQNANATKDLGQRARAYYGGDGA